MAVRKRSPRDPVRAFTFAERVVPGVRVHESTGGGKCIRLGGTVEVPLVEGMTSLLRNTEGAFLQRANGVIGYIKLIDRRARSGNIISENWVSPDRASDALTEVLDGPGWGLERVDYRNGELVEACPESCLVHVKTTAPGGELTYWADNYEPDKLVQGQVVRQGPKEFTQAVGVERKEFTHGPNGEVHALLRLQKGARFRLRRTVGDWRDALLRLQKGARFRLRRTVGDWREVTLSWNGTWLFERFPEERRKQTPQRAA